ncbi:MAG: hypothetical protein PHT44_00685 [Candidatus Portnoybacteria bacterium]|nr:hypothetical protein [Candidatus Portnoybacteria bacterium]MDD4982869.1 hypothetical protein [Candidatus Portnoybacteria bacterium]
MSALTNFFKNNIKLIIIIIVAVVVLGYFFNRFYLKNDTQSLQLTQFFGPEVAFPFCSVSVEQPQCYNGNFPTPTFKWKYCDEAAAKDQKYFQVQVSSQAYYNNVFPMVVFDAQKKESPATNYSVDGPELEFDKPYYWGVTVEDASGQKAGWWGWGDRNFKTAPLCAEVKK